jgi:trk system potassium uptake protein TrkA
MFYIIVGCGRVGAELAYRLYRADHQVTVIDHVGASFEHLPPDYRGRTIEGEAMTESVLERAGIRDADGFAAVTNSDTVNAISGRIARTFFGVPIVVTRNYDPKFRRLHESFGLTVVSSTAWGAQRIEEAFCNPGGRSVFSAGNGEVELLEFVIPAAWNGRRLGALMPSDGCVAASLSRGGRAHIPSPDAELRSGDVLLVSADVAGTERLRRRLEAKGD